MRPAVRRAKDSVFGLAASRGFRASATTPLPACERDLTSSLVAFHNENRIRWCDVPLFPVGDDVPACRCEDVICSEGSMSSEFRLIATTEEELSRWGNMIPDVMFRCSIPSRCVIIENKLGSGFTHGASAHEGQLAQYFRFLRKSEVRPVHFLLLTSQFLTEAGWYVKEIAETSKAIDPEGHIASYVMHWEDVLLAVAA
jgi:hypothetical protein